MEQTGNLKTTHKTLLIEKKQEKKLARRVHYIK